jgi:hypothetical protein
MVVSGLSIMVVGGHDRAPASFGEAFPNSLNTARGVAEGGLRQFDRTCAGDQWARGGEQADRHWLAVEAKRAVVPRGYSVLAPYGAKKLVCGRSWCQCLDIGRFCTYLRGTMRFH